MIRKLIGFSLIAIVLTVTVTGCTQFKQIMKELDQQTTSSTSNSIFTTPMTAQNAQTFRDYINMNAPSEDAFRIVQRLAGISLKEGNFADAAAIYKEFQPKFLITDLRFVRIISMLEAPLDSKVVVKQLNSKVNSSSDEYIPVVSADEKTLYFTALNRTGGKGLEDVWYTKYENGDWTTAVNFADVNTSSHESLMSISSDGTKITVFGNYPGSLGGGDLFASQRSAQGWTSPTNMGPVLNAASFESDAFYTSDNKHLLFVTDREGGIGEYWKKGTSKHGSSWGNTDIYVSTFVNGQWTRPFNLGNTINTPFAERNPFLHPDGKTLYFASEGHAGIGSLDVYKSTRLREDSWTEWSEPVNLGKQVNGYDADWGYYFTTSGDRAFFSGVRPGSISGSSDIYEVTLPEKMRAGAVITLSGKVTDENGKPLSATLRYEDLTSRLILGEIQSNPTDGSYFLILQPGKNYGYFAFKEGYIHDAKNLDLRKESGKESKNFTKNFTLYSTNTKNSKGKTFLINNLFFDTGKWDLRSESYPELDRWIEVLKNSMSGSKFEIAGHTDDVGTDANNKALSQNRANSVLDYLVSKGISKSNFTAVGYGKNKPVESNSTEDGRQANRRVEIIFR